MIGYSVPWENEKMGHLIVYYHQVVKRAGPGVDDSSSFADSQHPVGAKRSVRDRLGSNVDSSSNFNNKRFASSIYFCMLISLRFC